jgi:Family of unknown function (DUF5694)
MRRLAAAALLLSACAAAHPPLRPPDVLADIPKAKVLLVGTFHFDDPKLDTYKPKFPYDTMSAARQKEIAGVAAALAAWHPTKIGLEYREDFQPKAEQRYADYLAGKYELGANEIYQLGFRVGPAAGVPRVDGIDAAGREYDLGVDGEKWVKEHGQEHLLHDRIGDAYKRLYEHGDELKTKVPLRDYLLYLNSAEYVRLEHGDYLHGRFDVGEGNLYLGADDLAGWWYDRNLRIFENVRRLIKSPQERMLVIVGAGHLPILRHLLETAPDIELVPLDSVLR